MSHVAKSKVDAEKFHDSTSNGAQESSAPRRGVGRREAAKSVEGASVPIPMPQPKAFFLMPRMATMSPHSVIGGNPRVVIPLRRPVFRR